MTGDEDPFEFQKKLEGARTFDLSMTTNIERSESSEWIEPSVNADRFDMENVKDTIKVQGFDLDEPPPPDPENIRKALESSDPTADFKRNREIYEIICPVCKGRKKCIECRGRGRRRLIFKCRNCAGTGVCPDCEKDLHVDCHKCGEPVSKYSDTCRSCGIQFRCPVCGINLPAFGVKCPGCHTEFKCGSCKKPYPRQYSWRCPHCNHWNE